MFSKSKTIIDSPLKCVNYYRHFPTCFLKPYGEAEKMLTEELELKRLSHNNCEWLRRLPTAASEFAETLMKNLEGLSENESPYLKKSKISSMLENLQPFFQVLKKFDNKNKDEISTKEDVKAFLHHMLEENPTVD